MKFCHSINSLFLFSTFWMSQKASKQFKVIIVGDSGVGKTSIVNRYVFNEFDPDIKPTITIGYESAFYTVPSGETVKIGIWDPAGQEKFRSLTRHFYRNIQGAILVYDVTNKETLKHLDEYWIPQLEECTTESYVSIVVGNKTDMKNETDAFSIVSTHEGIEFARKHCALFVEVSAKTSDNVESAFAELIQQIAIIQFPEEENNDQETVDIAGANNLSYYDMCC
ncbi:Ras-related protein Rab-18 [Tritrichomonas foetus]|uniref:Ras-related protein Rab-18 n=1 Tax=Tritrichomonas foetus TaxID=1144522 RepID=A0A1J4JFB5_9EUKA|nr:Ras-related protein Rab-18 [Tritrichomonas foetus]|eukprot:OHS97800.1 Ras-related protein Rab-18 [Tritrichomonas foetus]